MDEALLWLALTSHSCSLLRPHRLTIEVAAALGNASLQRTLDCSPEWRLTAILSAWSCKLTRVAVLVLDDY
jgi:hypothetical protein